MPHRVHIAPRHEIETVDQGGEAGDVFLLLGGGDRRQRAAVEGALEGDDAVAEGIADLVEILANELEATLDRLDTGVGEEHRIGEARGGQALGQALLAGDVIEVRGVPQLARLLGERRDEGRMTVPEPGDRDTRREVEIRAPVRGDQESAIAPLERHVGPSVGRHNGRNHGALIQPPRS